MVVTGLSLGVMIVPVDPAEEVIGAGIYAAWTVAMLCVSAPGVAFMLRYEKGKWERMRIIELEPATGIAGFSSDGPWYYRTKPFFVFFLLENERPRKCIHRTVR